MNKLGFGLLRLPMKAGEVDLEAFEELADLFLAAGGTYFDTAYTYLNGKSEAAFRKVVAERYPRKAYRIGTKLPGYNVRKEEDLETYFREQQKRCGVEVFDVYMLHWLNRENYRTAQRFSEFAFLEKLKREGKVMEIGFSFHDSADLLDEILTEHPEVDRVLLQINYADWESPSIQSRLCCETAFRHGKKVMVMEPVKGGTLADPGVKAEKELPKDGLSPVMAALRFAHHPEGVDMVLSGMNRPEQIRENLQNFAPLSKAEYEAFLRAGEALRAQVRVSCTGCGYCLDSCPEKIRIPSVFGIYNDLCRSPQDDWKILPAYQGLDAGKSCRGCGCCEKHCPQKLPIRRLLKEAITALG